MDMDEVDIADWLKSMEEMMAGAGRHEGHTQQQVGRCVYCSCGMRVQGNLNKARKTLAPKYKRPDPT